MRKTSRIWITLLAMACIVALSSAAVLAEGEKTKILYAGWAWPGNQSQEPRIKAFQEANPDIEVEYLYIPLEEYPQRLTAMAAAGELPDVLWAFDTYRYVINGWLEDLTPWLEADPTWDPDLFWGNSLSPGTIRGRLFSLPFQLQCGMIAVNKDVLNRFNLRMPDPDWTWEDLWNLSLRMNRPAQNEYGMEDAYWTWEFYSPAWSDKTTWMGLSLDGTRFLYDDPDVAEAMKWSVEFERTNSAESLGLADGSRPDAWGHEAFIEAYGNVAPFEQSKAGFRWDWSWSFGWWHDNWEFDYAVLPSPVGPARQVTPLITDNMGMSASSKNKEAAFRFLRWMTYDIDAWKTRMIVETPVPMSMPVINDESVWDLYLSNEAVPEGMAAVVETLENGLVEPGRSIPGVSEAYGIITPERDQVRMGRANYDDRFPTIVNDQINQLLADTQAAVNEALDEVLGR